MQKNIMIFVASFLGLMFINQLSYGACFKGYCLAAAFPKVLILSVILSAFIIWISKDK